MAASLTQEPLVFLNDPRTPVHTVAQGAEWLPGPGYQGDAKTCSLGAALGSSLHSCLRCEVTPNLSHTRYPTQPAPLVSKRGVSRRQQLGFLN